MYLLPSPKTLHSEAGTNLLTPYTVIVLQQGDLVGAKQLQAEIRRFGGIECPILRGEGRQGDIILTIDEALPGQGYTLEITEKSIMLKGGPGDGLLHGIQTLRQIIRQRGLVLPCLRIEDAPSYPIRGYYFDVSRGRVSTLEALKRIADDMCFYKLNTLQLYVEHTYLFRDFSQVWRNETPLTAEEIMALDDYCHERGIELVPSLSCFGHMFEILCKTQYQDLCELENPTAFGTYTGRMRHHTINAADPRSIKLVTGMIKEFMPLFRSKKFNICCDETFDLGKGRGKAKMDEIGMKDFYTGFVKSLCEFTLSNGSTPMMWGDIILHFPEAIKALPEETVFLNWGYGNTQREDETRTFAAHHAKQYVCPGVSSWNQWLPQLKYSYDNISLMSGYGRKHGALGLLNTDWGDYGHIANPLLSLPGMIYGAAFSWSEALIPFEEINEAISHLAYLDESGTVVKALDLMNQGAAYQWHDLVEYYEDGKAMPEYPENTACLEKGRELLYSAAARMDTSARPMLAPWLLACDGVMLCNEAGACVAKKQKNTALATRLECWYHLYKQTWRQTAKEGDLFRIGHIIARLADEIRG